MKTKNVILFPKLQKELEEESIIAIKKRSFDAALEKLDMLLNYEVKKHEIYTGKLICLMELERYEEAQDLCEALIGEKDKHYYEYIHIYLTLLFQTNQYGTLMETVEDTIKTSGVPEHLKEPFNQLYSMSEKMRIDIESEQSNLYLDALYDAVHQDNHVEQWRLINKLSQMHTQPSEKVISLLSNEYVHPLNKSAIYLWMKKMKIEKTVDIHKFGVHIMLIPAQTPDINESTFAKGVNNLLQKEEQNNPTLYELINSLFEHYLYVLYPVLPPEDDIEVVAEAIIAIGKEYLNMPASSADNNESETMKRYIQEIRTSEILYSSILTE